MGANSSSASDDPTWVKEDQCVNGKCLRFDGTDDFTIVNDSDSLDAGNQFSMSVWVKLNNVSSNQHIIVKEDTSTGNAAYGFELRSNATVRFVYKTAAYKTRHCTVGVIC